MTALHLLSLREVRDSLAKGEVRAEEVTRACLAQIERTEPRINALLGRRDEAALEEAKKLDSLGPDPSRPLWGVPFTLKDSLLTKDMPTTAASRILKNFTPRQDAFVVKRLREAGAVILGKTNMDEFAMGSSTEFSAFGPSKNPWDTTRVPGGSSGGSAASVAACQCFASLGSDTGGSIRQPAAFCGCVGIKPTYGRVSRYGGIALGSSLDQIGPLARTAEDCALTLSVIAGHDPRDATSSPLPVDDYMAALKAVKNLKGLRIGLPREFAAQGLSEEMEHACREALDLARQLGAELVPVSLPLTHLATAVYYIIVMAEASSNLARFDGVHFGYRAEGVRTLEELYVRTRSEGFGEEVKRRIMLGTYVLSSGYYDAYYKKAAQVRRLIRQDFDAAFTQCDIVCGPVSPLVAWPLGEENPDPLSLYLRDIYTLPVNLAGLPGLSLPVRLDARNRMPTALQLIGRPFDEARLLSTAHALLSALPQLGPPPAAI
ncbi:MAG: Asp-tRNA(Asn)/Glu-tRNA(Gln) amidotransferase subunit GatA [Deltaproteobacteria bacterium]|jgi:aspartyl-tRNA(Asn)/glutamyl-tRNA(Gln) amidotransferase subunit A|nr:Asp-tRNA(Asn)/Glu-tRNA(Gln) amidotransferase subunit GatA [Deltaproteobacteria bacterium]